MLYLVNCEVIKSYYQSNDKKDIMNHIVEADTEEEAEDKIRKHYENKDEEYYASYWVNFNYCNELIT